MAKSWQSWFNEFMDVGHAPEEAAWFADIEMSMPEWPEVFTAAEDVAKAEAVYLYQKQTEAAAKAAALMMEVKRIRVMAASQMVEARRIGRQIEALERGARQTAVTA